MLQVLASAEVLNEYGRVVETLQDRVHVARVAQVLQAGQTAALRKKSMIYYHSCHRPHTAAGNGFFLYL